MATINVINSNNNTMDYNNCIWINHYRKDGSISTSTPYASLDDALTHIDHLISGFKLCQPEHQFVQISSTCWANDKGYTIRIEDKGDLMLHIKDTWIAISAHYDIDITKAPTEPMFLLLVLALTNLETDKLFAFADKLYKGTDN